MDSKEQTLQQNRLSHLDIARGIAIISVILGHLGNASINHVVFTYHVPIFYFITGYFTNDKKSISEFTRHKARTLLIPYFVTCLIITLLGTLLEARHGNALGALQGWLYATVYASGGNYWEPFYIHGIGAIWFLWATFWGTILLRLSLKLSRWLRLIFLLCLFVLGWLSTDLFWFPLDIQAGACAALFMYLGYLLRQSADLLRRIPAEAKAMAAVFAAATWYFFIRDFQSFWLVECDFGRGPVDIFGCICACWIIVLISRFIDRRLSVPGRFLAYFGRFSILVLCIHIIELDLFPWWQITDRIVDAGLPPQLQLPVIICGKLLVDLFGAWILSRIGFVRRLFAIPDPVK